MQLAYMSDYLDLTSPGKPLLQDFSDQHIWLMLCFPLLSLTSVFPFSCQFWLLAPIDQLKQSLEAILSKAVRNDFCGPRAGT